MALADCGPLLWPLPFSSSVPTFNTVTLDAADEMAWCVFTVPKTGTVVRIHFLTRTVTTGATVDARLETVNASGQPSGTLFGTDTNVGHAVADTDDNAWLRTAALTGSASVTAGDEIAVVVKNPSSSFGNMQLGTVMTYSAPGYPHAGGPLSTNKGDQTVLVCALEYDDGTFAVPTGSLPANSLSSIGLTTASNPDEVAVYFTPPFKCRVAGWWWGITLAAGADFRVNLYQSGNDTPLLTDDRDGDYTSTAANSRFVAGAFSGTQVLAPGTTYRLGLLPTTANTVTARFWECSSSYLGLLDTQPGKQALHYSARNRSGTTDPDAAAWSETTNRRLLAGVIIDQLDDGAGGAGGSSIQLVNQGILTGGRL